MARNYGGPFGSATGSGTSLTVTLAGTVTPQDLLLVFVAWEPNALPGTFTTTLGDIVHRNVSIDDYFLPSGAYFDDWGWRTVSLEVGFFEGPRSAVWERMQDGRMCGVNGTPCYPDFPEEQPSGVGSRMLGMWHPDGLTALTVTFGAIVPSEPYACTWNHISTWIIREWGGHPISKSGTVGTNATEPGAYQTPTGAMAPPPPPVVADVSHKYACMQGEHYFVSGPGPVSIERVSDGGETRSLGVNADGSSGRPLVPHVLEYGIAGRWGQGAGTFSWNDWPGCTLIGTVDHAHPEAPAHFEIFYKLLPGMAVTAVGAAGTFGAQTNTQVGVGEPHYRGHPTGGGAMWRGSSMAVASVGGGWMPQIYRRLGPAQ